jgi:hypothetical protein
MPFPPKVREEALVNSRRCCCVCREFHGRSVEVHHIEQEADGGANTIENAVALCLRCHGEVGHYNARHPIGSKYTPDEVRRHRDEWWDWCAKNPTKPLPNSPINVTPAEVKLWSGEWSAVQECRVCNLSDRPLFRVWLQIIPQGTTVHSINCEVQERRRAEPLLQLGDLIVSTEHLVMTLRSSAGDDVLAVYLAVIDRDETIFVKITARPHQYAPDSSAWATATVLVIAFSEEPLPPLQSPTEAAIRLSPFPPFVTPAQLPRGVPRKDAPSGDAVG